MRTAKATAAAWYLDCPECGEGVLDAQGSSMWSEAQSGGVAVAECINGHRVRIPKFLRGEMAIEPAGR